jgi:hypothetical protein
MKVVEKLFIEYLRVQPEEYVKKYLSAKSVLELSEDNNSAYIKRAEAMRDQVSEKIPISLFKANRFLTTKETRLTITKGRERIEFNKREGDDYKIREQLGKNMEEMNRMVVRSMSKYNSDRARKAEDSDFEFEEHV